MEAASDHDNRLAKAVVEHAKKTGFESGLRVASLLRRSGWHASQNVYYIDKDENKPRELDAHAYKSSMHMGNDIYASCAINLCIEVKRTSDPFVFFSSPPGVFEPGSGYGLLHHKKNIDNNVLSYRQIEQKRPMRSPSWFGRTYASLKEGKTAGIQAGIMSAVKGAIHQLDMGAEFYDHNSRDISFFIPMMVVDGIIMSCHIDEVTDRLIVEEVDQITYLQHYLSSGYGSVAARVHVLRMSVLDTALAAYEGWSSDILDKLLVK